MYHIPNHEIPADLKARTQVTLGEAAALGRMGDRGIGAPGAPRVSRISA